MPEFPWPILKLPPAESVNVGAYTPMVSVVVAVSVPEVPVMVSVYGPTATELDAASVSVLLPVVGLGEKDAVTPVGRPETERFTLPVKPYCGLTET